MKSMMYVVVSTLLAIALLLPNATTVAMAAELADDTPEISGCDSAKTADAQITENDDSTETTVTPLVTDSSECTEITATPVERNNAAAPKLSSEEELALLMECADVSKKAMGFFGMMDEADYSVLRRLTESGIPANYIDEDDERVVNEFWFEDDDKFIILIETVKDGKSTYAVKGHVGNQKVTYEIRNVQDVIDLLVTAGENDGKLPKSDYDVLYNELNELPVLSTGHYTFGQNCFPTIIKYVLPGNHTILITIGLNQNRPLIISMFFIKPTGQFGGTIKAI